MAFSTTVRVQLNSFLAALNLELSTLTAKRREHTRIDELIADGRFDKPAYAILPEIEAFDAGPLSAAYARFGQQMERLRSVASNDVGYDPDNGFFRSPDMEPLYLLVRTLAPRRVIEVGCGNSTRITRQAILDGCIATEIVAIDPSPRKDVRSLVDEFIPRRLEQVKREVFERLEPGDFLFIDSSHEVRLGNDVARIFCDIVPLLKKGVVLHFHDIYFPFEYPLEHAKTDYRNWGEQYLLHAFLQGRSDEILWPGYFLQKMRPDLQVTLPFLRHGVAQSFWFRLR